MPLSRPIAVALMVLVLIYAWNSYLLPKVFLIDDGMGVVTQLPEFFRRQYNDDTPKILAASVDHRDPDDHRVHRPAAAVRARDGGGRDQVTGGVVEGPVYRADCLFEGAAENEGGVVR